MKIMELNFIIFIIYSFLGWLIESILELMRNKKFVNRGFLIGPYCPIYGYGVLLIMLLTKKYQDDILVLSLFIMVICGSLEYSTSYIMEKAFHARWWDYSEKKYNINGRICLETVILFVLGGQVVVYIINPFLIDIINNINPMLLQVVSIILFVIYIADTVISFKIIFTFKNTIMSIKDNTEEITRRVKEKISESSRLGRRLLHAFPNIDIVKDIKNKISGKIKRD